MVLIPNGGILGYHYFAPNKFQFFVHQAVVRSSCFKEVTTHDGSMGRLYTVYLPAIGLLFMLDVYHIYIGMLPLQVLMKNEN